MIFDEAHNIEEKAEACSSYKLLISDIEKTLELNKSWNFEMKLKALLKMDSFKTKHKKTSKLLDNKFPGYYLSWDL